MAREYGFDKNGVKFGFDNPDLYHYEAFKGGNITSKELRREYSRLRAVASKRLQRMEGTKWEKSQTYLRNAGKYGTLADIEQAALANAKSLKPEAAQKYVDLFVAKKLDEMYKFLTAKTGSIRGMQRAENELIQTLHDRGLTFVNKSNIAQFGEFMEFLRTAHQNRLYDSERAAELFGTAVKKGINPMEIAEDWQYWQSREEELSKLPKIKNKNKRTADEYRKLLDKK